MDSELASKFQQFILLHKNYLSHGSLDVWGSSEKEAIKNNFTYHSSKIEGLTLTYGETIRFLKDNIVRIGMKMKDVYDLKNHKDVLNKIFLSFEETELTEQTIKDLHGELMKDDAQWEVQDAYMAPAGHYKTENNFTFRPGSKPPHMYLGYELVPGAIKKLVTETQEQLSKSHQWTDSDDYQTHPLSIISGFHYKFLQIHPFSDGNGRIARLLTTLLLLKKKLPPIMITELERSKYFQAIIDSEEDPVHTPIISFFVDKSIEILQRKLNSEQGPETVTPPLDV